MEAKEVFISYSSRNNEIAHDIAKELRSANISVWIAPESISGGKNYTQAIPEGLGNSKLVVFVYSKACNSSEWILDELSTAKTQHKTIIPFLIDESDMSQEMNFILSRYQRITAYPDYHHKLQELISAIKNLIGGSEINSHIETNQTLDEAKLRAELEAKIRAELEAKKEEAERKAKEEAELKARQDRSSSISRRTDENIIIGIDFGTTNCRVSVYENGRPKVIETLEGGLAMPSVISFTDRYKTVTGTPAKRKAIENPQGTIFNVKRLLGESYSKCSKDISSSVNKISNKKGYPYYDINNLEYSPYEIAALLFLKIKASAENYLGVGICNAVVTVPACATSVQRQAIVQSAKIAGINVRRIINDTSAAALAYGFNPDKDSKVAVLNLGGGTFSISTIEMGSGIFETLATAGNTHLGGEDFTEAIVNWLVDDFEQNKSIDLRLDSRAMLRVREAAEKAKIELSTSNTANIYIPYIICTRLGETINLSKTITRQDFSRLTKHYINSIRKYCEKVIHDSEITFNEIDEIILVGGASRMKDIQDFAINTFGKNKVRNINPDDLSVIGAAIQLNILTASDCGYVLLDTINNSIGIETTGNVMTNIINANSTIPCKKTEIFSTAVDNQTAITIHVLEGEDSTASNNISLGTFNLEGIAPAKKGIPQIEVTFDIDSNGTLTVSAKDKATGREQHISIDNSISLTEQQIESMCSRVTMIAS